MILISGTVRMDWGILAEPAGFLGFQGKPLTVYRERLIVHGPDQNGC